MQLRGPHGANGAITSLTCTHESSVASTSSVFNVNPFDTSFYTQLDSPLDHDCINIYRLSKASSNLYIKHKRQYAETLTQ